VAKSPSGERQPVRFSAPGTLREVEFPVTSRSHRDESPGSFLMGLAGGGGRASPRRQVWAARFGAIWGRKPDLYVSLFRADRPKIGDMAAAGSPCWLAAGGPSPRADGRPLASTTPVNSVRRSAALIAAMARSHADALPGRCGRDGAGRPGILFKRGQRLNAIRFRAIQSALLDPSVS